MEMNGKVDVLGVELAIAEPEALCECVEAALEQREEPSEPDDEANGA